MKTKLTTSMEIRKTIQVRESWLGRDGLELLFIINGEEKFYEFTPLETARLFRKNGLITNYCYGPAIGLVIEAEYAVNKETTIPVSVEWATFVNDFHFSQYDAIMLATAITREQRLQDQAARIIREQKREYYERPRREYAEQLNEFETFK